ncbi:MAG: M56 family metallopeptidase [Verrucomicrobiaceae bacterium]|nr:M56 family metallopeptidase [Verrucomicrobiaceae bacterium]
MNAWVHHPLLHTLGWVVVHLVWQASMVAAVLWGANCLLRRASARSRHVCAWLALLVCTALPVIIATRFLTSFDNVRGIVQAAEDVPSESLTPGVHMMLRPRALVPSLRVTVVLTSEQTRVALRVYPVLAGLWMIGGGVLLWRFRRGWSLLLRRLEKAQPATLETREMLTALCSTMGWLHPVDCRQSDAVSAPVVAGVRRPMIVVPADFESSLPLKERRMLLAHEMAHLIRRDPWWNAMQCLIETFLFWHPAVLWMSRCIRHERELCADELAVRQIDDRPGLAHALGHLAESCTSSARFAVGANSGSLLRRVQVLLGGVFPLRLQLPRLILALLVLSVTLRLGFEAHAGAVPKPRKPVTHTAQRL